MRSVYGPYLQLILMYYVVRVCVCQMDYVVYTIHHTNIKSLSVCRNNNSNNHNQSLFAHKKGEMRFSINIKLVRRNYNHLFILFVVKVRSININACILT